MLVTLAVRWSRETEWNMKELKQGKDIVIQLLPKHRQSRQRVLILMPLPVPLRSEGWSHRMHLYEGSIICDNDSCIYYLHSRWERILSHLAQESLSSLEATSLPLFSIFLQQTQIDNEREAGYNIKTAFTKVNMGGLVTTMMLLRQHWLIAIWYLRQAVYLSLLWQLQYVNTWIHSRKYKCTNKLQKYSQVQDYSQVPRYSQVKQCKRYSQVTHCKMYSQVKQCKRYSEVK